MIERERWRSFENFAEIHENFCLPAMFGQWAPRISDAVSIAAGDRVLDVGCGTGALAREAVDRVGPTGRVVGLDFDRQMLEVARRLAPQLEWHWGDATSLPYEDASFDVVANQFALMLFPDRAKALKEMMRVLVPSGRLAIAVWAALERAPGYAALKEIVRRRYGRAADGLFEASHSLGEKDRLEALFHDVGIQNVSIEMYEETAIFPSIETFVRFQTTGPPLGELLDDAGYQTLLEEMCERLEPFRCHNGEVVFPKPAYIATARKV